MRLSELAIGQYGTVAGIRADFELRRRLQDIGLTEGTKVCHLFTSPLGDPLAYKIRGAVIALRRKDAQQVSVWEVT